MEASLFDVAFGSIQASIRDNDGGTLFSMQEKAETSCLVDQSTVEKTWRHVVERLKGKDDSLKDRRLFLLVFSRCVQYKNVAHKLHLHFIRTLNFAARSGTPQGTYISLSGARVINSVGDSLNSLVLRGCKTVTNAHITELSGLRRLAILDISGTSIGDNGVRELASALPQLEALYCASTSITDNSGEHLRSLSKLVKLDISMTRFGDDGIEALCLPKVDSNSLPLDTIFLGFTRVTLNCLTHLINLPRLIQADFKGCTFSIRDLKAYAPKLVRERQVPISSVTVEVPLLLTLKRSSIKTPRMRKLPSDVEEENVWRVSFIRQLIAQGTLEEGRSQRIVRSTSFVGSPWKQSKQSAIQEMLSPGGLKRRNSSEILFGETPLTPSTPKRRPSIIFTTSPYTPGPVVNTEKKRCRVVFPCRSLFKPSIGGSEETDECATDNEENDDEFDTIGDMPFTIK